MFLIIILLLFGFAPEQIPCSSWETLRFLGNKIHCSPRNQSLNVNYLMSPAIFILNPQRQRFLSLFTPWSGNLHSQLHVQQSNFSSCIILVNRALELWFFHHLSVRIPTEMSQNSTKYWATKDTKLNQSWLYSRPHRPACTPQTASG